MIDVQLPSLREIRSFIAVAEHQSFGRAAAALDIAQPSLSLQIQKLERELGVTLFRRSSRAVELTDAGSALLTEARTLIVQAQIAVDSARQAGSGEIGSLTIGFYDSAPLVFIPVLVGRFRKAYPRIHLDFRELSTREQLTALARGDIDIGILRGPILDPHIDSRRIAKEPLLAALPQTHPLAKQSVVKTRALRDEPFVLLPRTKGAGLYDEIILVCRENGFSPNVVQEANETHTVCGLVAAGVGASIVPGSVRAMQIRGIVYRPISPLATIVRCVAWRRAARPAALRAFLEMLPASLIEV